MSDLDRAVEFSRAFDRRRAERIERTPHGEALMTPSTPLVYHRNHLSVDLAADVSADELIAEADSVFGPAGYRFRKITVDDDLGARVAPRLQELGWRVEELLVMPYRGPLLDVDTSIVDEVTGADLEPMWIAGLRESPEISTEEEVRQLVTAQHGRRKGADVGYFVARVDGDIASYCELFLAPVSDPGTAVTRKGSDLKYESGHVTRDLRIGRRRAQPSARPIVGQIESVMTLEPFRNRGLAKAVVTRALEESLSANSEVTFIVADARDWPKELYAKLGFETAGRMWDFLKTGV
jgi:GNAT superfamily N-acetyltransferase